MHFVYELKATNPITADRLSGSISQKPQDLQKAAYRIRGEANGCKEPHNVRSEASRSDYVPIQNNQAERDLREFVILRKISGETKSLAGDRSIERHLSIIQTARKQGLNVFETLHGLLTNTLPLSVLTANIA